MKGLIIIFKKFCKKPISLLLVICIVATLFVSSGGFTASASGAQMATFDATEHWTRILYGHTYSSNDVFEVGKYRFVMDCIITNGIEPFVKVGDASDGKMEPVKNGSNEDITVNYVYNYDEINRKYTVEFEVTECFNGGSHPIGVAIGDWSSGDVSAFSFANPALYALDSKGNITGESKINPFTSDNIYKTDFSRNGKWRNAGSGYKISDYDAKVFAPATPQMITFTGEEAWTRITYGHTYSSGNVFEVGKYRFVMDCVITNGIMPDVIIGDASDGMNPVKNDSDQDITVNYVYNYDAVNRKYTVEFEVTERFTCGSNPIGITIGDWRSGGASAFSCANPALYALDSSGNITGDSKINPFTANNLYSTAFSRNGKWRDAGTGYYIKDYDETVFVPVNEDNLNAYVMQLSGKKGQSVYQIVPLENLVYSSNYQFSVDMLTQRLGVDSDPRIRIYSAIGAGGAFREETLTRIEGTNTYTCTYTQQYNGTGDGYKLWIGTLNDEDAIIIGNPKLYKLDSNGEKTGSNLIKDPGFSTGVSDAEASTTENPWFSCKTATKVYFPEQTENYFAYDPNADYDPNAPQIALLHEKASLNLTQDIDASNLQNGGNYKFSIDCIYVRKGSKGGTQIVASSFADISNSLVANPLTKTSGENNYYCTFTYQSQKESGTAFRLNIKTQNVEDYAIIGNPQLYKLDSFGNKTGENLISDPYFHTEISTDSSSTENNPWYSDNNYVKNTAYCSFAYQADNFFNLATAEEPNPTGTAPQTNMIRVESNGWESLLFDSYLVPGKTYKITYNRKYFGTQNYPGELILRYRNADGLSKLPSENVKTVNEGYLTAVTVKMPDDAKTTKANLKLRFYFGEDKGNTVYLGNIDIHELNSQGNAVGNNLFVNGGFYGTPRICNTYGTDERESATPCLWSYYIGGTYGKAQVLETPQNFFSSTLSTPKRALRVTGKNWSCIRQSLHLEDGAKYQLTYKYKYDTNAPRISMQQVDTNDDFSSVSFSSSEDTQEFKKTHTFTMGNDLSSGNNYTLRFWVGENSFASEAYWYDIKLYKLNENEEITGNNLLDNGDFALGALGDLKSILGWQIEGAAFDSIELSETPDDYFTYYSPADTIIYLVNNLIGHSQNSKYISLDRNKDGTVNIIDLIILKKLIANADEEGSYSDIPADWYSDSNIRISLSDVETVLSMQYEKPKNVIMMIGDGMGANDIRLAAENSPNTYDFGLVLNKIINTGFATTRSNDHSVTDSAAGGTALSTGFKTNNGMIGVSSTGEILKNLTEYAKDVGKKVGVVTNDSLTGATPADFLVHVDSRGSTSDIAAQIVNSLPDVVIGQEYKDFANFDLSNYLLAKDFSEFRNVLNSGNRQCDKKFMGFINYNATYSNEINILSHCTEVALNCLSQNSPNGFFLMVENTTTDNAGHANNINSKINGVVALDRSVAAVLKFMKNNPDTLLIITSDHETGGVTIPSGSYSLDESLFTTTKHTNANVRTFAIGYGTEYFKGKTVDNTDVAKFAIDAVLGK